MGSDCWTTSGGVDQNLRAPSLGQFERSYYVLLTLAEERGKMKTQWLADRAATFKGRLACLFDSVIMIEREDKNKGGNDDI